MADQCSGCRFFQKRERWESGYCRRYPPTVMSGGEGDDYERNPMVKSDDWCGEFQAVADAPADPA